MNGDRYRVIAPAARDWMPGGSLGMVVAAPGGRTTREHQPAVGGPGDLGSQITDAWGHFLSSAGAASMVALGVVLLVAAAAVVVSQTAPAQTAGRLGVGAARRGARFIPGVGALA